MKTRALQYKMTKFGRIIFAREKSKHARNENMKLKEKWRSTRKTQSGKPTETVLNVIKKNNLLSIFLKCFSLIYHIWRRITYKILSRNTISDVNKTNKNQRDQTSNCEKPKLKKCAWFWCYYRQSNFQVKW